MGMSFTTESIFQNGFNFKFDIGVGPPSPTPGVGGGVHRLYTT